MTGLLVLSMAPVIVRWSGAAKPCGPAKLADGILGRSGAQT